MELSYNPNKVYPPYEIKVSESQIENFNTSIGLGAADSKQILAGQSLPTFATSFRGYEFKILADLGIELKQCLHTYQEYQVKRPFRGGDCLSANTQIEKLEQKAAKEDRPAMVFLTMKTEVKDSDNQLILISLATIMIRGVQFKTEQEP